ncbi:MAG: sigma 54-interacting transcriptional regulator [Thermovenabulum sp.]|uniref:sigma 54-interacting transcriptional regulator n=2 Tax=Thermovenabulum sp. TaxID=3100335 RepID=UPI003C7B8F26
MLNIYVKIFINKQIRFGAIFIMNLLLIAPYENLLETAYLVKNDLNIEFKIEYGNLKDGLEIAKKYKEKGIDVIISRGGTYQLIKENVDIPVVEIKVSPYDILRQFKGLVKNNKKICVAGYKNVIYGCELIGEVFNINIIKTEFCEEEDIPEQIKQAIKSGAEIIIGDAVAINYASNFGIENRLITSGKEAIANAVNEAIRLIEEIKKEKAKTEEIRTILDFIHDGVIAVDKKGKITIYNKMAEKIFRKPSEEVLGKNIEFLIPDTKLYQVMNEKKSQLDALQEIGEIKIATNRVPIIVENEVIGAVATFQEVNTLMKAELKIRKQLLEKGHLAFYRFNDIVHKSEKMSKCIEIAKKYSQLDSTILIFGESGTGKEIFAQSIHNESKRKNGPFVAINCAALPENLLESELFGYAEGAFTGAKKGGKVGLFELAHNGTIFLDEISEMPLSLQSKLLRVMQEKKVMRLGDDKLIPINIRIICATNRDLLKEVNNGNFRQDLFYRINILPLFIPPLRERKEDIIPLAEYFLKKYSKLIGKNILGFTHSAVDYLLSLDYPGNVRELEGIIERACAVCEGKYIDMEDLIFKYFEINQNKIKSQELSIEEQEKNLISKALTESKGNITLAAKLLGIHRTTLWRKIKKYNIDIMTS